MDKNQAKYYALELIVITLLACFFIWVFLKILFL